MKNEMKDIKMQLVDTTGFIENIHYQFKTIQGIKGFENLTHVLVGDFENGEFAPFNIVKFDTKSIIITQGVCKLMLDNLDLTRSQEQAVKEYSYVLGRLSPSVYAKLLIKLEDHIKQNY